MSTTRLSPFKRFHVFYGQRITAEDWNAAEEYHIRKRVLHNQCLHTPGVLDDYIGSLEVKAAKDGIHLEVSAGCAIDENGRELLVTANRSVKVDLAKYEPGQTLYVVLSYDEKTIRDFQNDLNVQKDFAAESERYKFIEEDPKIDVSNDEQTIKKGVELARIHLKGSDEIRAQDIDTSHVTYAGPKVTLKNAFTCIEGGPSDLKKGDEQAFSFDLVGFDEPQALYFVSARLEKPGRISWQIESELKGEKINYSVRFKLLESEVDKNHVRYQVYKLT